MVNARSLAFYAFLLSALSVYAAPIGPVEESIQSLQRRIVLSKPSASIEVREENGFEYDARDLDEFDARDFDEYDARDFDEYDARDFDEFEYDARDFDEYEARDFDDFDARDFDDFDARDFDDFDARDFDELEYEAREPHISLHGLIHTAAEFLPL